MHCRVTVGYTYMDDGVWLFCECGWSHNCGFAPTIEELAAKEKEHTNG